MSKASGRARISVDAGKWLGELDHIWTYLGQDELNWVYTKNGKALLRKIGEFAERPYYVRVHNTYTSGNRLGLPRASSTNAYREDKNGNPIYDWTELDKLFDAYVANNIRAFVELGFMPKDLMAENDAPSYSGYHYHDVVRAGMAYPPKDYNKWHDLVYETVRHCIDRYGQDEVTSWYWEVWNEPDIAYWQGTFEEYCKLYDYTAAAIKRADPNVRVGGPATTGSDGGMEFLDGFLDHCANGTNYHTGGRGVPIDFISYHIKGAGYRVDPDDPKHVPSMKRMVQKIEQGLDIIAKYPTLSKLECHLTECDPCAPATRGIYDNPNLHFRNTEYYPTFVAALVKKVLDVNSRRENKVTGLLSWAFQAEGMRYFEGIRQLTTNGIDMPILNLFRMYSSLGNTRLELKSDRARDMSLDDDERDPDRTRDIDGLASMSGNGSVEVMLWNHHDDWDVKGDCEIDLQVENLPFGGDGVRCEHYRIDSTHSNSYTEWKRQGCPQEPTEGQLRAIKSREGLEMMEPPGVYKLLDGKFKKSIILPTHSVSLLVISPWRS
ncbi:MAG: GH39 family glycosyl hydrolase [bacterium]